MLVCDVFREGLSRNQILATFSTGVSQVNHRNTGSIACIWVLGFMVLLGLGNGVNITDDVKNRMLTDLRAASPLKERPLAGHKEHLNDTLALGIMNVTG